jgi:glycolate oxidase FAD binding subunit
MADTAKPRDAGELQEAIAWAAGTKTPIELVGSGSRRVIGRPVDAAMTLDVSALAGIDCYEPDELVLTAGAATPLVEIEALLAQRNQALAFEPPHLDRLLGGTGAGTLGGIIAGNLSGPRRLKAGAVRDHFLGFSGVSGRGETFKSGSRVMKNVTGYDLPKLIAGSWGTLAALSSVTVKVLPAPETEVTLAVATATAETACQAMSLAMQSAAEVSGAAHVPEDLTGASVVKTVAEAGRRLTFLRLEGIAPSVAYRADALTRRLCPFGEVAMMAQDDSKVLWREIRDVAFLADRPQLPLWRVSVPPTAGHRVMAVVAAIGEARAFMDWAGGLVWVEVPKALHGYAEVIRASFAGSGGHATLIRACQEMRAALPVFEPQPRPLAELSARVKAAFDPLGILNPGRMYPGHRGT